MDTNLTQIGEQKLPSIIQDPFKINKITRIYVSVSKSLFSDDFNAYGSVEFKNGNTKGEQKFNEESFDEVVLKIKAFLTELK